MLPGSTSVTLKQSPVSMLNASKQFASDSEHIFSFTSMPLEDSFDFFSPPERIVTEDSSTTQSAQSDRLVITTTLRTDPPPIGYSLQFDPSANKTAIFSNIAVTSGDTQMSIGRLHFTTETTPDTVTVSSTIAIDSENPHLAEALKHRKPQYSQPLTTMQDFKIAKVLNIPLLHRHLFTCTSSTLWQSAVVPHRFSSGIWRVTFDLSLQPADLLLAEDSSSFRFRSAQKMGEIHHDQPECIFSLVLFNPEHPCQPTGVLHSQPGTIALTSQGAILHNGTILESPQESDSFNLLLGRWAPANAEEDGFYNTSLLETIGRVSITLSLSSHKRRCQFQLGTGKFDRILTDIPPQIQLAVCCRLSRMRIRLADVTCLDANPDAEDKFFIQETPFPHTFRIPQF